MIDVAAEIVEAEKEDNTVGALEVIGEQSSSSSSSGSLDSA